MGKNEVDLGAAELEVLRILWDDGPSAVRDVRTRLAEQGRRLAHTTVLTVLTRLEQKGVVASDKSGVAYVYRAKVSRERITSSRLRTLIHQLYDGAAAPLVLQLMQSERFSPEELEQLQRLIDRLSPPADRRREK